MTTLVVDASVALKWLIEEEGSSEAERLFDQDLLAPALLRIEASNVLRTLVKRDALDAVQAVDLMAMLQEAPLTIVDHDDALERRALEIALELEHPVYDCLYIALAERIGATVVTADKRFLRALQNGDLAHLAIALG